MSVHNVASPEEMRELVLLDILKLYRQGPQWSSYFGHPSGAHIKWDGDTWARFSGNDIEANNIRQWIAQELALGNE